jgi:hypothetical protein
MTSKSIFTFAAAALMAGSLPDNANAAVIFYFEQVGADVVATPGGSFEITGTLIPMGQWAEQTSVDPGILYRYDGGNVVQIYGGTTTESGLNSSPTKSTGPTFGYFWGSLYIPEGVSEGSTYTPTTVFTWEGKTLAEIGLGSLTTTPFEVFKLGEDTISFALIPEPATSALFMGGGMAAFAALLRRRRAKAQA